MIVTESRGENVFRRPVYGMTSPWDYRKKNHGEHKMGLEINRASSGPFNYGWPPSFSDCKFEEGRRSAELTKEKEACAYSKARKPVCGCKSKFLQEI